MYNQVIKFLFRAIIITGFLFLPVESTVAGMDTSFKLFVFSSLVVVLLFFYFLRVIHKSEVVINKSPITVAIVTFLIFVLVSSIFSIDKPLSIFGSGVDMGFTFSYTLFLTIFFIILITHYKTKDNISYIVRMLLYSHSALIAFCYFIFFAYLFNFSFTPFLESVLRLSIGSFNDLAMYISLVSVFIFAVSINKVATKLLFPGRNPRKFLRVLLFFSFAILVLINFLPSWICLFVGFSFILFLYKLINLKSSWEVVENKYIIRKMFYLFLVVFFLILNLSTISNQIFSRQLHKSLLLPLGESIAITSKAVEEKPFIGNGGETFRYVFSKYRGAEMNMRDAWNLRFRRSATYFLEMLSSFGILGTLAFLVLMGLVLASIVNTVSFILKKYSKGGNISQLGILVGIIAVLLVSILSFFVYSANYLLIFFFYLFLALFFVYSRSLEIENKLVNNFAVIEKESRGKLFIAFVAKLFILIFVLTILTAFNFKIVAAAWSYDSLNLTEGRLKRIIMIDSYNHFYKLKLAEFYKNQIVSEASLPESERDTEKIAKYFRELEMLSSVLAKQNSSSVVVQESVAQIYYTLETYIPGSYRLAIEFFLRATELEPSNPVILHHLGLSYLAGEDFINAEKYFRESLQEKPDYSAAKYSLSELLSKLNRPEEAITLYTELLNEQYQTTDVYFALGQLYFNNGKMDQAISNFEKVLLRSPNHSNALYSMALAYEKKENTQRERYYLEKVLELNPGAVEIKAKLDSLE